MALKKLKSLVLAFGIAVGGAGIAATAQAQTVSPTAVSVTANEYVTNNYVAPEVVDAVSRLPMNAVYHRAGVGFTSARVDETGENVGVEYCLTNGQKTPVRVYNLDDGNAAQQWRQAIASSVALETRLSVEESSRYRSIFRPAPPLYVAPPTYVYVRPVQPVLFVGPVFSTWHPPRATVVRYNDHHRNDFRHDNHRDHRGGGPRHHR